LLAAWAPANRFEANLVQELAHIGPTGTT
jgi:hypothetical protein